MEENNQKENQPGSDLQSGREQSQSGSDLQSGWEQSQSGSDLQSGRDSAGDYSQSGQDQSWAGQQYNQNPFGSSQQYNQNSFGSSQQYNQNSSGSEQQYNQNSSGSYPQYSRNPSGGYWQQDQFQKADNSRSGGGFGIASMILGILSLVLFCSCINIPIAVAAVVFGVIQLARNPESKAMSIVGIVTAVLSVLAFIVTVVLMLGPLRAFYYQELQDFPQSGYEREYDGNFFDDSFVAPFFEDSGF